jgi:hypothetical protein
LPFGSTFLALLEAINKNDHGVDVEMLLNHYFFPIGNQQYGSRLQDQRQDIRGYGRRHVMVVQDRISNKKKFQDRKEDHRRDRI